MVKGALLSTQTFELDESVYETANEVWLNTDFSFVPAGKMQTFVIEAELAFDDGTSFTGEIMGYVRAGK